MNFKTNEEIRNWLIENGYETDGDNAVGLYVNEDYSTAFEGVSTDGRAVYNYNKMIQYLMDTEHWTYEESVEWIDYNTLNAYFGDKTPIIFFPVEEMEFEDNDKTEEEN